MQSVPVDTGGSRNLGDVVKLKFVKATNPPVNEKVVLDGGDSVSSINGINAGRAVGGLGDGATGWVKVREINPPAMPTNEAHVQFTKATGATFFTDGEGFAVLVKD